MPKYMSHVIMGKSLYDKCEKDDKLFKLPIEEDKFKIWALGQDLSGFSNIVCRYDSHNQSSQDFFLKLINYIKENKLYENSDVMSFLYGHISHYFFDSLAHPFVYYIEKSCKPVNHISSHSMVEGFIDNYYAKQVLNIDYMQLAPDFIGKLDLSDSKLRETIRDIYLYTYNGRFAVFSCKVVYDIFKNTEKTIKENPKITKEKLLNYSKFIKFLDVNHLAVSEIINNANEIWTNPVTNEKHNESLLELYNLALNKTLEAIDLVNRYIYDGGDISILYQLFPNLSYDTGVECALGKQMKYVRTNKIK